MKPILSLFAAFALAGQLTAQTVSGMNELSAEQKAAATELKLTGKLSVKGNSDFRQLRDLCWQLRNVDLSVADCEAVPKNAFHSRRALQQVILPSNVKTIGKQAFFACRNLQTLTLPKRLERVEEAAFS